VKATEKERMKEEMAKMKVVGRAKVTQDRIYSMAYHPEKVHLFLTQHFGTFVCTHSSVVYRPRIFYSLETSMGNWESGMQEPLQTRKRRTKRTRIHEKAASIGGCSFIGPRAPKVPSVTSSLTL